MNFVLILSLLVFFVARLPLSAEVQIRIDEKGRKVFFNIPSNGSASQEKTGPATPFKFSKNAGHYESMIEQICEKYEVDPELVKAVIQVESAYNAKALSHAGAIGLMQLMPATAARFGVKEIYDPNENIHGGVKYIKFLLGLFDNNLSLAVAAYNAGEGAVQRFKGIPRYEETQNYVKKVLNLYGKSELAKEPPKTIYKYIDHEGKVHFTTQKPQQVVEVIELRS